MKQTTIQTDAETLGKIKLYCLYNKVKAGDFVKMICGKDQKFVKFCQAAKKLEV